MEETKFDFSKVSTNNKLTKEDIFEKYDQIALFEKYFGKEINFKKSYCNRLRGDNKPGCKFKFINNILCFRDFAKSKSYNVITWVMEDYNLTFPEALRKITEDFKFNNISNNPKIHLPYEIEQQSEMKIQIVPKAYSKKFIDYYKKYFINEEICKEENVYCVDELYFNNNRFFLSADELCIAYYFPEIDKLKILRPDQPKQSKWRTNVPNTYIDGLSELDYSIDYVIIVKSKKDKMLIKSLGYKNVLSIQMEGEFVITEETKEILKDFYKIIWLDNDPTGKRVSEYYKSIGFSTILFEDFYYNDFNVTDPTDYAMVFQEVETIKKLLNKQINERKK